MHLRVSLASGTSWGTGLPTSSLYPPTPVTILAMATYSVAATYEAAPIDVWQQPLGVACGDICSCGELCCRDNICSAQDAVAATFVGEGLALESYSAPLLLVDMD